MVKMMYPAMVPLMQSMQERSRKRRQCSAIAREESEQKSRRHSLEDSARIPSSEDEEMEVGSLLSHSDNEEDELPEVPEGQQRSNSPEY